MEQYLIAAAIAVLGSLFAYIKMLERKVDKLTTQNMVDTNATTAVPLEQQAANDVLNIKSAEEAYEKAISDYRPGNK